MSDQKNIDFVVRLVGSGVKPWDVPMRSLSRLMDAIQRLVEQQEVEEFEDKIDSVITEEKTDEEMQLNIALGSPVLKLVGIRASSAGYDISTPRRESALALLESTGSAIENPGKSDWTAPTISSLKVVSEVAQSLGVNVEIRKANKGSRLGDVIAKITPDTYRVVASTAFVRGQTSLFGTIERVGGSSEARCTLRLPDVTKLVYCSIASDDLARRLSPYLYQDVSVHGEATWLRANWRVCSFTINSFDPPKTGSFQDAFDEIWKAGGKAWDRVKNPNALIADMRGA